MDFSSDVGSTPGFPVLASLCKDTLVASILTGSSLEAMIKHFDAMMDEDLELSSSLTSANRKHRARILNKTNYLLGLYRQLCVVADREALIRMVPSISEELEQAFDDPTANGHGFASAMYRRAVMLVSYQTWIFTRESSQGEVTSIWEDRGRLVQLLLNTFGSTNICLLPEVWNAYKQPCESTFGSGFVSAPDNGWENLLHQARLYSQDNVDETMTLCADELEHLDQMYLPTEPEDYKE